MAIFNIIIEKDESGFFVSEVVGLPGCHTQAKTLDELLERTKEAISLYLEIKPSRTEEKFFGFQQIEVNNY
ncbi:MAG: type II toxin-antitoxin system HicB family antitoxin [Nanoarchaeota archaeon]|nr:type II toxin-antitoxin system HicB family antitoxin [Nanoarchaeota archaeon]